MEWIWAVMSTTQIRFPKGRSQTMKSAGKNSKNERATKCHTTTEKISKNQKVPKWPRVPKRRKTRLFVVSAVSLPENNPQKARRARTEFHKFWTDCPAC